MGRLRRISKKGAFVVAATLSLATLTLLVVLPAFGTAYTAVPPKSTQGVLPALVSNGGQDNDCSVFYPGSTVSPDGTTVTLAGGRTLHQFYIDNPKQNLTVTDPSTGATFGTTVDMKTNTATFTATGAAVVAIGIKGGTQTTGYSYDGTADWGVFAGSATPGAVTSDGNLHPPQQSTDKQGNPVFYNVSHFGFCYQAVTTISGTVFKDTNGDGVSDGALPSLATVTLTDTTTNATRTAQTTGTYSFANAAVGDTYRICVTPPTTSYVETKPTSGTSCSTSSGFLPYGYSLAPLTAGNGGGNDFGLEPYGSLSGTVYEDASFQNGTFDSGTDTVQTGWFVKLYKTADLAGANPQPVATSLATTGTSPNYSLPNVLEPGVDYTLCEVAPSGTWAQSQPGPSAADRCANVSPPSLPKGYQFVAGNGLSGWPSVTYDFGNAAAVAQPCDPPTPFGLTNDTAGESYTIQLAACKPGQTFVFGLTPGTVDNNPGTAPPTASVWVGDETMTPLVPLVERIIFPFAVQPDGTQPLLTLHYDDTFPFSDVGAPTMPFCKLDPRDGTEFGLDSPYDTNAGAAAVLPGTDTSCLIVQSQSAATGGDPTKGTYTAYVYSELDGLRFAAP